MKGTAVRKKIICALLLSLALPCAVFAQSDKRDVRKGNRKFERGDYQQSQIDYQKALLKDSLSIVANYNLANSFYKLGKPEEAEKILSPIADTAFNAEGAPDIYHNMANVYLEEKKYGEAVESYKNSLRLRPDDMETKANLAYAQKMLRQQQQQEQQQQQQQDNQDNQNDQDKDKDRDDRQNQDDQNRNNEDQDRQDGQDNPENDKKEPEESNQDNAKITPQAAQQIFKALEAKEKKTQEKVNREKALLLKSKEKEKNW